MISDYKQNGLYLYVDTYSLSFAIEQYDFKPFVML